MGQNLIMRMGRSALVGLVSRAGSLAVALAVSLSFSGAAMAQDVAPKPKPTAKPTSVATPSPTPSPLPGATPLSEDAILRAREGAGAAPLGDVTSPPMEDDRAEAVPVPGANVAAGVTCQNATAPCVVDATGQPLRVLPRSFAPLYEEPSATSRIKSDAVSAFKPAMVFERRDLDFSDPVDPQGWYLVGYSRSAGIGWMRARDVVEWRQALLLAYTHPGEGKNTRTPVIMFETSEQLQSVVASSTVEREAQTQDILSTIERQLQPDGVIARESSRYLDIDEDFYMLPVLDWWAETAFDEPAYYLQVFAAVPNERAVAGEGTLVDPETLENAGEISALPDDGALKIDVVFVLDMTGSMQPYIDAATEGFARIVADLAAAESEQAQLRFGLVGYRDDPGVSPGLEWASRNFTPELVDSTQIVSLLGGDDLVATRSSDEWAEDVYAGVNEALSSAWSSPSSVRIVILVGDASAHEPGVSSSASKSSTNHTAQSLRARIDEENVYLFATYLQDDIAAADWDVARAQFSPLATNPGGEAALFNARADNLPLISTTIAASGDYARQVVESFTADGAQGVVDLVDQDDTGTERLDVPPEAEEAVEMVQGVFKAALVDYLGDSAGRPKDFVAWVHDYDLLDPTRPTLTPRVMVTRAEFDTLLRRTKALQEASSSAIFARVDFFEELQSVSARTSLGIDVAGDETFADQDFLPLWVEALPYRSRVLSMTPESFAELSAGDQAGFERTLLSKVTAMEEIAGDVDAWYKLDENDPALFDVTALPLSLLP